MRELVVSVIGFLLRRQQCMGYTCTPSCLGVTNCHKPFVSSKLGYGRKRRRNFFSHHVSDKIIDSKSDEDSRYQEFLQRKEGEVFESYRNSDQSPIWLQEQTSLPFACTSCGKCCKTRGAVYMNNGEIKAAASYLKIPVENFYKLYAASTSESIEYATNNTMNGGNMSTPIEFTPNTMSIRLKEVTAESINGFQESACIFLDRNLNQCTIYEARPIQCRTYPFWPSILKSIETWNNECRLPEPVTSNIGKLHESDVEDQNESSVPLWTPEIGGCEGMKQIDKENPLERSGDSVPMDVVYRNLFTSRRAERYRQGYSSHNQ